MRTVREWRTEIENRKGEQRVLERQLHAARCSLEALTTTLKDVEEARVVIQTVAQQTQEEFQYVVSRMVGEALRAVFDDPYTFSLEFVQRRGRVEADVLFVNENGDKLDPSSACGGGPAEVAAFALRLCSVLVSIPKVRHVLILDEPFRFLSRDLHDRAATMVHDLSNKLGVQFIIVTHDKALISGGDVNLYKVDQKKRRSYITREE